MSAGDRDTLTDTAELLIEHQINLLNSRGVECLCGWYLASDPTDTYEGQVAERFYRQHLAEVIGQCVRAAQAQAWKEGSAEMFRYFHQEQLWLQQDTDQRPDLPQNPYLDATDQLQDTED